MEKKEKNGRRAGAGGILLGIFLSLALAGGCVYGLSVWGSRQAGPAAETAAGEVRQTALSLYQPEPAAAAEAPAGAEPAASAGAEPTASGEAPASAEPTASAGASAGAAADYGYDYDEILTDGDGLLIARIQGKRYKGFIAVIDDPTRLDVGTCGGFAEAGYGKRVNEIADAAGAVLAVNGGGFADPNGVGTGGMPTGIVMAGGELLYAGARTDTVGIDGSGVLHAGVFSAAECQEMGLVWALSYGPTLIVDGTAQDLNDSLREPRTAVGQREDGAVILVNIQGRQVSALGVTLRELAEIMADYGAVNASNLDGGASSDMYYNGAFVNIANTSGGPRPLPTALLVMPAAG